MVLDEPLASVVLQALEDLVSVELLPEAAVWEALVEVDFSVQLE